MFNEINFQFMKKNYIKPEVMIVEVKQTQMLATSQNKVPLYINDDENTTEYQW